MSEQGAAAATATGSANEAAVGDILDDLKNFRHNYWAPLLLGFIMLFDSWDSIAIALAIPSIAKEWNLEPMKMGVLISSSYAGQFIGAVSLGVVAERFGRLPVVNVAVIVMSLLAFACALAPDFNSLLVLRFLQGITIGGALPVAISYINELAPTKTRGRYFGMFQTLAISGFSVAALLSPFIIPTLGWRWMLGLGGIPLALVPLVWLTLPESPRWLARIGRLEDANRSLVKLGAKPATFTHDAAPAPGDAPAKPRARANVLELTSPVLRGRTITVTMLWFLTMFTSFGLTTWAPSIFVQVYNIPIDRALTYISISSLLSLFALATAGLLIDRFGRRPFALGGLFVTLVVFLGLAIFGPTMEMVVVSAVIVGKVAIFYGTFMLWPYTAESFPTNVRALALGYSSSIGRGASMIAPVFIGFVLGRGAAIGIIFATFGMFALIALAVWIMRTKETKGLRLDAI